MSRWTIPSIAVFFLIFILSFRLLSDPDLGFHLKAGKWIVENRTVPDHDISTYTVSTHEYIDLHWLFQICIYFIFSATGYKGLSLLVTFLSFTLLCLLLLRNRMFRIPISITSILLFFGYLIIEPRIMLRPEMFTFIYISLILIILDTYLYTRRNFLFLLPLIMLLWCNSQALFILGFALTGAYFISLVFRDKKIDKKFFLWMIGSVLICFCNPYFIKGFSFPIELFTRFEQENIFNQHIKEFSSISRLNTLTTKEILFILFAFLTFLLNLLTYRKRKPHEFILLAIFFYLALIALRNIPLFIIIAFPIASAAWKDVQEKICENFQGYRGKKLIFIQYFAIVLLSTVPVAMAARIYTNAYYVSNRSYNKTGIGLDLDQQPYSVASFLVKNKLKGRIINSLSFGGWLSWSIPQPVFIDARLEVMKEDFYQEIFDSWNGGLQRLIEKYNPDLLVYNYQVYYPWTLQLASLPTWRLIYIDGLAAVFAHEGYMPAIKSITPALILNGDYLTPELNEGDILVTLNLKSPSKMNKWLEGFYRKNDYSVNSLLNTGSFYLQIQEYNAAEKYLLQALRKSNGKTTSVFYALADIYRIKKNLKKLKICYHQILKNDPENSMVRAALSNIVNPAPESLNPEGSGKEVNDAVMYFNSGNQKYKQGNVQGAMTDFNKAIRLNPGYYKAYNNRGIIRAFTLKQLIEAICDFDTAIKMKDDYADAYLGRGSVKFQMNDLAGACQDWRKSAASGNLQAAKLMAKHCSGR